MLADFFSVGFTLLPQPILRGHQHPRRAVTALKRVAITERGLQIGDLAAIGQSLDGLDRCAMGLHREHQAGPHDLAIDAQGARTAHPVLAADMGTGEMQMLAQKIRKIDARQHVRLDALAIDLERNGHGSRHAVAPALRSGRWSSAATPRASSTFARCRRMAGDACWSSCGSSSSSSTRAAFASTAGVTATP